MAPWIQTYTGKKFNLAAPTMAMFDVRDIAHALALQPRFTGHTRRAISIAQHSVVAAWLAVGHSHVVAKKLLFHDASEAYYHDLPSPAKAMPCLAEYLAINNRCQSLIYQWQGLSPDYDDHVHQIDMMLARTEAESPDGLITILDGWTSRCPVPSASARMQMSRFWSSEEAEHLFHTTYQMLSHVTDAAVSQVVAS